MKCFRVCAIMLATILLILGLFFAYLNDSVLNNLSVEYDSPPSLNSNQKELYAKVFKKFVNEVHNPNRAYIKEIYESRSGDIVVHIGYFNESFSLMYVNGKIIKGYSIRDQPTLPCYYVFDKNGRFLRSGNKKILEDGGK